MLKNSYLHRHFFLLIFWAALWFVVWIQVKEDLGARWAFVYTSTVMLAAIGIAHILNDKVLPRAIKTRHMQTFVLRAAGFVLLLAVLISALDLFFILHVQYVMIRKHPGMLFAQFFKAIISSLLMNGTACGIRFYQEHAYIQQKHSQLQQLFLENQLKSLQDQVNPQFMFTVLGHIRLLIKEDSEQANALLLKFSDMLRYQLYESSHFDVPLLRELQYLQDFIAIEKIRRGRELEVHYHWLNGLTELRIKPMVLVCLVENIFKHLPLKVGQPTFVKLFCQQANGRLQFTISHTAYLSINRRKGLTEGLEQIKKRLDLHYADNYVLSTGSTGDHTTVQLEMDTL